MPAIPGWARVSATAAPAVLAGGWLVAAPLQPAGYDPVRDTVSALAKLGATDRWVMTGALAAVGCCYLVTALGLHPAGPRARLVLGAGGVATLGVAAFPQPASGSSAPHQAAVAVAVAAMALWPLLLVPHEAVTRRWAVASSAVLLALCGWFVLELVAGLDQLGLAERAAVTTQAAWPGLYVVAARGGSQPAPSRAG